jgi:hypothetical protein
VIAVRKDEFAIVVADTAFTASGGHLFQVRRREEPVGELELLDPARISKLQFRYYLPVSIEHEESKATNPPDP